jgi:hypothetical protein
MQVVNVAGPRESKQPGLQATAKAFLLRVLGGCGETALVGDGC